MTLLSFLLLFTSEPGILHRLQWMLLWITSLSWGHSWFTHKVPHTTISASTSKGLRIYFWYQSEALLDLLLWTPEYPVTPKNLRLLPLKKYLHIFCQKSLVSSQTHVFAPDVSNSSAQATPRNCFRSLSAKTACMKWCFPEVLLFWKRTKHLEKQMGLSKKLAVVNDRVDCGVAFIQDFNE